MIHSKLCLHDMACYSLNAFLMPKQSLKDAWVEMVIVENRTFLMAMTSCNHLTLGPSFSGHSAALPHLVNVHGQTEVSLGKEG